MENYMKCVQKMDILDGTKKDDVYKTDNIFFQQEMQVVNESGLYYMIMRSMEDYMMYVRHTPLVMIKGCK